MDHGSYSPCIPILVKNEGNNMTTTGSTQYSTKYQQFHRLVEYLWVNIGTRGWVGGGSQQYDVTERLENLKS